MSFNYFSSQMKMSAYQVTMAVTQTHAVATLSVLISASAIKALMEMDTHALVRNQPVQDVCFSRVSAY